MRFFADVLWPFTHTIQTPLEAFFRSGEMETQRLVSDGSAFDIQRSSDEVNVLVAVLERLTKWSGTIDLGLDVRFTGMTIATRESLRARLGRVGDLFTSMVLGKLDTIVLACRLWTRVRRFMGDAHTFSGTKHTTLELFLHNYIDLVKHVKGTRRRHNAVRSDRVHNRCDCGTSLE